LTTKTSGRAATRAQRPLLRIVRDPEPELRPFHHESWCTSHFDGAGDPTTQACNGTALDFDFGARFDAIPAARLSLSHFLDLDPAQSAADAQTVVNADLGEEGGTAQLKLDQAEAIAHGLLALVAQARGELATFEAEQAAASALTVRTPRRIGGAA
jgi:hypothetical protein